MSKKKKICNLIILDASGSMTNKAQEVRHGLKTLFKDIRTSDNVKNRTIVCDFSSAGDFQELVNTKDVDDLTDGIAERYKTRGMTALYDAIAKAFRLVKKDYDGVFVNIMTDGLENNSVKTRLSDIQELIADRRKKGWAITFMGTTEEALQEARKMGLAMGNAFKYEDSAVGAVKASSKRVFARERFVASVSDESAFFDADNLMKEKDE